MVRPFLERLEDRDVPVNATWKGAVNSTLWSVANNWFGGVVPNGVGDTATFDNTAVNDCTLDVANGVNLLWISVGANFTRKITLDHDLTLYLFSASGVAKTVVFSL
jgi:hypothetical protein